MSTQLHIQKITCSLSLSLLKIKREEKNVFKIRKLKNSNKTKKERIIFLSLYLLRLVAVKKIVIVHTVEEKLWSFVFPLVTLSDLKASSDRSPIHRTKLVSFVSFFFLPLLLSSLCNCFVFLKKSLALCFQLI